MEMTVLGKNAKYGIAAAVAVALFFLFDSPLTVGVKAKLAYLLPISDSQRDSLIQSWCERAFIGSSGSAYSSCYFAYRDEDYVQLRADCRLFKSDIQDNPKFWQRLRDDGFMYVGDDPRFKNEAFGNFWNLAVCNDIE